MLDKIKDGRKKMAFSAYAKESHFDSENYHLDDSLS